MFQKTLIIVASLFFLLVNQIPGVMAQTQNNQNQNLPSTDQYLHKFIYKNAENEGTKISYVANLPQGSWQEILGQVIRLILNITGTIALISFTVSGIMMVAARGEEDMLTKAKTMIVWSIIALLVIAASYAIVLGVSRLNFFGNV